jgi:hypothetical protein
MPYKDKSVAKLKRREYYLKNKERIIEANKAWGAANPEKVCLYKTSFSKNLSQEKREEYNKKARIRYSNNKTWNSDRKKAYRASNKLLINDSSSKRRSAQLKRHPAWLSDFDNLKIKCIYSIASMLSRENKEPWVVDHIIPLQGKLVSGLHVPSNLQVMRARENEAKRNKFEVA